jgi:hypothetical protein
MEVLKLSTMVERLMHGPPFPDPEGVFVRLDDWNAAPLSADLVVFTFDEAEEFDDDAGVPVIAKEQGLRSLLGITDLEDVIKVRSRQSSTPTLDDYVKAIDHYREYDSFMPDTKK